MRIHAHDLAIGDVLQLHDWRLHITAVEHERATAVLTAEFASLLHFTRDDWVEVVGDHHQAPAAA
ncbi:MAG: hypothetical protein JWO63_565 [Frankiales bacterium]|nr:hypothetical protein [Frankiales bacterium]